MAGYEPTPEQKQADEARVKAAVDWLNAAVASYVPQWYRNAREQGDGFYLGSIDGEAGRSLKIWKKTGIWKDYNPGNRRATGDMIHLAAHVLFKGNTKDAIKWAISEAGLDGRDPARIQQTMLQIAADKEKREREFTEAEAKKRKRAEWLWRGKKGDETPPIAGTPAEAYLLGRGINLRDRLGRIPRVFRYRPDVWCDRRSHDSGIKYPAMLAAIMDLDGKFLAVHRTYLDISGWDHASKSGTVKVVKLPILDRNGQERCDADGVVKMKSHKLSMGTFAADGGSITLWKGHSGQPLRHVPEGEPIYISEGIEDGLSWAVAHPECHVRAGVSLNQIGNVKLPQQAGPLVILMQNDAPGSDAEATLERVIATHQSTGRKVQLMRPPNDFKDWNDFLLGKVSHGAGA